MNTFFRRLAPAFLALSIGTATAASFTPIAGVESAPIRKFIKNDSGAVYVLVSGTIYKSANGGSSWNALPGQTPEFFRNLTVSGSVLFAASERKIYRSDDDGANWTLFTGTNAGELPLINNLDVFATASQVFATGLQGSFQTNDLRAVLYRSSPTAAAWQLATPPGIGSNSVHEMAAAYSGRVCALITSSGARFSDDNGQTWSTATGPGGHFGSIHVSASQTTGILVTSTSNVRRSTDNCGSFAAVSAAGLPTDASPAAVGSDDSGNLYVGYANSRIFRGTTSGNFMADNSGDLLASTQVAITDFVLAGSSNFLAGTSALGVMNRGATWTRSNSGLKGAAMTAIAGRAGTGAFSGAHLGGILLSDDGVNVIASNAGISNLRINDLARDGSTLLAATGGIFGIAAPGLFISADAGATWAQVQESSGLTAGASVEDVTVGIAGTSSAGVYLAAVSGSNFSGFPNTTLGIYRSTNGGSTWTQSNSGLPANQVLRNLAVDASGNFYVYVSNNGVYRSSDGGQTWTAARNGLNGTFFGKVFAAGNTLIASAGGNTVFRSTDSGASWSATTGFAVSRFGIEILSLVADANGHLYLGDEHAGLSISMDGGQTWRPDSDGLARSGTCMERINGLLFKDGKIYAAQGEGGGVRISNPVTAGTFGDSVACTTDVDTFPNTINSQTKLNQTPASAVTFQAGIGGLGNGATVPVSIVNGEYAQGLCTDNNLSFTSAPANLGNVGLCIRHTASSVSETAVVTTLNVADQSPTFTSRSGLVYTGREDEINTGFGTGGFTAISGLRNPAQDLLILPDGKILVGSTSTQSFQNRFGVARLNADGTVDTSFGSNGTVTVQIGSNDNLQAVLRQSDGKIVLVGWSILDPNNTPQNGNDDLTVITSVRLNADGTTDSTYGTNGIATFDINSTDQTRSEIVGDAVMLADNSIIAIGAVQRTNDGFRHFAVKLSSTGAPDTGFGGNESANFPAGVAVARLTGSSQAEKVLIQSDGKILLVGSNSTANGQRGIVTRFTANGAVDATYGDALPAPAMGRSGIATVLLPAGLSSGALMPDGKLVVAGGTSNTPLLVRLNTDGSVDNSFGGNANGRMLISGVTGALNDVIRLADGRLAVAGGAVINNVTHALYAIVSAEGALNNGFGPNGQGYVLRGPFNGDNVTASMLLQRADGGVLVGGIKGTGTFPATAVFMFGGDGAVQPPPGDTTPDDFSFTAVSNAALDTLVESNTVTITGINQSVRMLTENLEYSLNGAAYTSAIGSVSNGNTVKVRLRSSAQPATSRSGLLIIGNDGGPSTQREFSVTTVQGDTTPESFSFTAQTNVDPGAVVESNTANITGINAGAAISVSGGEYRINGGTYTNEPGTVQSGSTVQVRHTATLLFNTQTLTTLTVGGVSASFSSTTRAQQPTPDTTPDAFSFTDQTGATPGGVVTSNSVTISGINAAAAISISGGEYRIGDSNFTSAPGQISNGQSVQVRVTAAAAGQSASAVLSIGGVSDSFSVTSASQPPPDGPQAQIMDSANRAVFFDSNDGTLVNVRRVTPPPGLPASARLSNGVFAFDLENVTPGSIATVTVDLPAGSRFNNYLKFGTEPGNAIDHYYNFRFDSATGTGARITGTRITLFIQDNGRGDHDPMLGRIADPGGPVLMEEPVTASSGGGGAWSLWSLLLALTAVLVRRQQTRKVYS